MNLQLTNQIPDLHYPTIPYNTLKYLTIPTLPSKYCDLIGHSEARGCSIPSKIVDHQLINQIPDLHYLTIPYNTLKYLTIPTIPTLPSSCNKSVIRLATQRPEAVASRAKQSEIVDRQLINQIPDLHYPTIPYNALKYLTIPTLPYSCNKYCDLIGHSEAQGCSILKQSEIVEGNTVNNS